MDTLYEELSRLVGHALAQRWMKVIGHGRAEQICENSSDEDRTPIKRKPTKVLAAQNQRSEPTRISGQRNSG